MGPVWRKGLTVVIVFGLARHRLDALAHLLNRTGPDWLFALSLIRFGVVILLLLTADWHGFLASPIDSFFEDVGLCVLG
jgi:hypothetical protein